MNNTKFSWLNTNTLKNSIPLIFLLILCFYPLMPFAVLSISIILFAVTSIAFQIKGINFFLNKTKVQLFLIQTGFFVFMLFSILYSSDKTEGLKELQRGLPLVILPLCFLFFTKKVSASKLKIVLLTFVVAKLLYVIYIYNYFIYRIGISKQFDVSDMSYVEKLIFTLKLPFRRVINNSVHVITNPPKIFFHKTYLSMSLLFAICIIAYYFILKNKKLNKKSVLGGLLILLFSLVLFQWFSIINLALYFLLGFIFLISLVGNVKQVLLISFSLIILSFITYNIPVVKQAINTNKRITNNIEETLSFIKSPFSKKDKNNRKGSRAAVNECSIDLMQKALVFGYGIGTPKALLNQCYKDKNFELGMLYKLNSHNYYFHIILSTGLIGLILFVFLLYNNFKIAINQSSLLYISFLLIVIMNLITENIIFRAHGIVFFALFNSLFYKYHIDNKQ